MATTKRHIQRWAPQDYRTSRTRARSIATKDPLLRLVYLEALFALYEAGGSLTADPDVLADELGLPAKEIARRLPILDQIARSGSGRGGILLEGGRITNGRVTEDLATEQAYSADQAERGRIGGTRRAASAGQASGKQPPSPPLPLPLPLPLPAPLPAPAPAPEESTNGADWRAGGGRSNSSGPPARPQGGGFVLDHDPTNLLEARVASKVAHLASMTAARDGDADPLELLRAVSATESGVELDHIRGAPERWLEETSRACDVFEDENFGGDEPQGRTT